MIQILEQLNMSKSSVIPARLYIDEVQLQHPIAYDNFNLCDTHKKRSLRTLSIAMLKIVC